MVSRDEVIHVANIAKLKFDDDKLDTLIEKFTEMVEVADTIMEVDTDGVEPSLNINGASHIKDYPDSESLTREEALKNTVESQYGYFKILKVIE